MKLNTILFLFLIICCISFTSSQNNFTLSPRGVISEDLVGSDAFKVHLDSEESLYEEFIRVTLESRKVMNPMIMISKDDPYCTKNRLYSGIQSSEETYYIFKKQQIFNKAGIGEFYICLSEIQNATEYRIIIANEDKAYLSIDSQTSYFVTHHNTKMTFNFVFDENLSTNKIIDHINIWAKGQNITEANVNINRLTKRKFEYGFVFYGDYSSENEYQIEVEGQIGDYITIGSISYFRGTTNELKENSKEIIGVKDNFTDEICFPVKFETAYPMHINGRIYTRKAMTYYREEESKSIIDMTKANITNGILNDLNSLAFLGLPYGKSGYFCIANMVEFPDPIIFSIQMTTNRELSLVHPPMIHGEIRRHFLLEGEIAAFYGLKPKETATEVNLNLKALKGFPKMYFDECTNFPNCQYINESLVDKKPLYPSNRMTVYSFYIDEESIEYKNYNPITSFQPIMIVYCAEGGKKEFMGESSFCEFDTSYFTNEDRINIYEESTFSQYLLKDESDQYKISLENENHLEKIYLDLILFSGDVDLRVQGRFGRRAHKYYVSNKIYYSIHLGRNNTDKEIEFEVLAKKRSFYMVQYQCVKAHNDSRNLNVIESGINFISSIRISRPEDQKKLFDLINYKSEHKVPYLVTFYSQNSRFYSYRILSNGNTEEVVLVDNYGQMIIESNDDDYVNSVFKFGLEITQLDETKDRSKNYVIYISGLELPENVNEWNERVISLSDGVPHRYTFTQKHPFIFYAYHISDYSETLILNFLLKNKGTFDVNIYIGYVGKEPFKKESVYRDGNIYIYPYEFLGQCEDLEVCTVIVCIEMNQSNEGEKLMEFSMYQNGGNPIYLEKNVIKKDIILGNKVKHYYFDIDSEEFGDITLDFKRGSGNIYASVQEKNPRRPINNTVNYTDWRGKFVFPMTNDDSLKYATYNKKIIIDKESTKKCREGCFVLISVVCNLFSDDSYEDDITPYRISLNPRIISSNGDMAAANPKVKIDINEFVIGDINFELANDIKYDYYEVTLPYDSDFVYIDWQADSPSFLINVGKKRPVLNESETIHFSSKPLGDTVYQFAKEDIIKKLIDPKDSLKDLTLTIGIYSDNIDSVYSSPYAFKIYLPQKDQDVIHIRSDQKVQCLTTTKKEPDNYLCYFAVIFDEMDFGSNLVIYPRSHNGEELTMYGNLFDAEKVEKNEVQYVKQYFDEIYGKSQYKKDKKYIYINKIPKGKSYLFITVSKQKDIVEILSSTHYLYENMVFYPNPSSAQIFALGNKKIRLNFGTIKDLLLNIVSISEEGYFNWDTIEPKENKKFYLNGFEDRLSLTTYTEENEFKLASLMVDGSELTLKQDDNSGFIFYITYYPRGSLDQIRKDRSMEINYRTVKMPLNYYAPIDNVNNTWLVNFNFYDFNTNDEAISYDNNLFNIWGSILTEEEALKARFDSRFIPKYDEKNSIKGIFDSAFGMITINKNNFEGKQNPFIFFSVNNSENINYNYTNMNLELSLYSYNADKGIDKAIPENVYLNGKISNSDNNKFIYMLNYKKDNGYIFLEFSSNTNSIQWVISSKPSDEENEFKIISNETQNGKDIIIIAIPDNILNSNSKIYLIVFTKVKIDPKLGNYIFKYTNTKEKKALFSFSESNNNITCEKETVGGKTNYKISFYPIEFDEVSYYIKAVYIKTKVKDEKIDTIAISESPGRNMQINNPKYKAGEMFKFVLEDIKETISYIKVMAKVNNKSQKLFLLYTPIKLTDKDTDSNTDNPSDNTEESNKTALYVTIGVSSVLFAFILILLIIVFFYKSKNKDLLAQVNKISFVENKDDDNLLLDDENSLTGSNETNNPLAGTKEIN